MGYNYLDEGTFKPNLSNSWKRKWSQIPRLLRFYLLIAIIFIFILFMTNFYFFGHNGTKTKKIFSENESLDTQREINKDFTKTEAIESVILKNEFTVKNSHLKNNVDKLVTNGRLFMDDFKTASEKQNDQQKMIQEAILHSWKGYHKYAWGYDHLKPITKQGTNWFRIGLTILDSIDTLLIAGLENEYKQALEWVEKTLTFDVYGNVNCFETTIRALAGLLSAFHLTQNKVFLQKATDLGDRLIHCFDSPSHTVPFSDVNLKNKNPKAPAWSPYSSLSEVSSMQIEFRDLTYETNNKTFEVKSFATSEHIHKLVQERGDPLLPMYINPITGQLFPSTIILGARADSYYEYLYKQYLQTNIDFLLEDYVEAINQIKTKLFKSTTGNLKLFYIGEMQQSNTDSIFPKMDHLVCFLSGTLALGYYHQKDKKVENYRGHPVFIDDKTFVEHLKMAEDLARTCHYMYNLTKTGLSPEIAYFGEDEEEYYIKPRDKHNLLRPEFVESLFFLYHITGKQIYREWGLQVFNAFQKYSRISSGGYTTLDDVQNPKNVKPKDMMESFWIAETLKYLYLLFMDDKEIINKLLNNYVFNTEGHLLLRRVNVK